MCEPGIQTSQKETRSLTRKRLLTGLIGAPIAHSAAPAMHEEAAHDLGLRCHYQLIEVAGANLEELRALLEGARRLGFAGVNVTYPYKEAVVGLLDELSPDAAAIGAVNTVVVRNNRLIGYNTDTSGFARAAAGLVAGPGRGCVALIGAGGVGKAIAFALVALGIAELRIFDAERAKAEHLALQLMEPSVSSMQRRWECFPAGSLQFGKRCCTADCGWRTPCIIRFGRRC
jgi:shikimate dehydrogenase